MTRHQLQYEQGAVFAGGYRFAASRTPLAPIVETLDGASMGTGWRVKYWVPAAAEKAQPREAVREAVESALHLVVAQMSTWDPTSVLSRFNAARAGSRITIPEELDRVLRHALAVAAQTAGAFDPTIGPLVNLWGFGPRDRAGDAKRRKPTSQDLATARARCGYEQVVLDGGALYQPGGLYIDLSAIAKGYAVDLAAARLARMGVEHCLVEIGGELFARGVRPDGHAWQVAVAAPRSGESAAPAPTDAEPLLAVPLRDRAIATSGDHWHYFAEDGGEYAHTLDPRTGCPVAHRLASVTVVDGSCMSADALATVLTVMGPDAGYEYALNNEVAALFVRRAGSGFEELMTPRFSALLK